MKALIVFAAAVSVINLSVAALATPEAAVAVVQPANYPADRDARADLAAALADARTSQRTAIVVFGADWCHDSRTLARVLKSDAFEREFGPRFSVTFVDVGKPQTGQGRNLDLIASFGVQHLRSTPAMFLIGASGKRLNTKRDALGWRNAESRGDAAILGWFRQLRAVG